MWTSSRYEILTVLKKIDGSDTPDQAVCRLMEFAKPLGFDRFLISQLVNPLSPAARNSMRFSDWPKKILEDRFSSGSLLHDPIVRYGMRSRHPFAWSTAFKFESRYGTGMQNQAREFQMNDGYMFPMRRPGSPDGGVSLAAEKLEISQDDVSELQLAAMHCYYRLESLHPTSSQDEEIELSRQERDVLQFAAAGKTFWEMGTIMGVSESAAKDAMRRARKKLNCGNTVHAVSTAIARDMILP